MQLTLIFVWGAKPRHNPYSYRLLGPFLGKDSKDEAIDDDVAIDNTRCQSWTREQKLGAPSKTGSNKLIANNAAAVNIGCTPKMLRT